VVATSGGVKLDRVEFLAAENRHVT
jgi:hypothetical protein